ncbi:MAG: universal stress protein [Proteobacteria bacterium]|nr:universal stress protein [Pseudomonadota bacterium]
MKNLAKKIMVAIDGSENSLRSLDYIDLMYGPGHNIEILLFYVLPALPPILTKDSAMSQEYWDGLRAVEKSNVKMAEKILADAKSAIIEKGFDKDKISTISKHKDISIALDIAQMADNSKVDAILLSRHGRTGLKDFFMGEISSKLLEYCKDSPVWVMGGPVNSRKVLVGVDNSENALRAVAHAGAMLSGTECHVTLFHSKSHIRRFVPLEVLENAPGLEEIWQKKAAEEIAPYMMKAKEMLLEHELKEDNIDIKIIDGSRSVADDIIKAAKADSFGTIILGRRGISKVEEFFIGSVTRKVIQHAVGFTVWVVQ